MQPCIERPNSMGFTQVLPGRQRASRLQLPCVGFGPQADNDTASITMPPNTRMHRPDSSELRPLPPAGDAGREAKALTSHHFANDRFWPEAELQAMTLAQAALRSAGGGSCLRQRSIQRAVSFS